MELFIFTFNGKTREITREEVARSMSVPLGRRGLNIHDREQAEAVYDILTSAPNFLTGSEADKLGGTDVDFESLFKVIR